MFVTSALNAKHPAAVAWGSMPSRSLEISQPFDLYGTTRALGVGERIGNRWVLATSTEDGVGTIVVEPVETTDSLVTVQAETWGDGADELLRRLPVMLGVDDPIWGGAVPFPLRDLDAASRGLRLGASHVMYETAVATVLGQLVTTRESKASFRRIKSALGVEAPGPHPELKAFPEPEVIAAMGYDELHRFGIERKRAATVIEVSRRARRMAEALAMSPESAYKRLVAIQGVGPWTASTLMGSVYGDRDAVILGDYHLPNSVAWALSREPRADDDRMLELLEPFRPFRRRVTVMIKQAGIHAPKYGPRTAVRDHL
jgi:3-methyladenine DNA glycosylase/8-oxoguanine DNA glycosylase